MRLFLFALACVSLVGCATARKDYAYMGQADYQNREAITGGLQKDAAGRLTDAEITRFLSGKVTTPKSMTLGFIRLSGNSEGLGFTAIEEESAKGLFQTTSWGPNVKSIVPVPSLLVPRSVTIEALRESAARLQADMLVIVSPATKSDWKMNVFKRDEAKATTFLEVVLLDTRTGAIPFTALVEESSGEIKKADGDYSNYEMMNRARAEAEVKALQKVPGEIRKYFSVVK